jgi:hypothetical protein
VHEDCAYELQHNWVNAFYISSYRVTVGLFICLELNNTNLQSMSQARTVFESAAYPLPQSHGLCPAPQPTSRPERVVHGCLLGPVQLGQHCQCPHINHHHPAPKLGGGERGQKGPGGIREFDGATYAVRDIGDSTRYIWYQRQKLNHSFDFDILKFRFSTQNQAQCIYNLW